MVESISNFMQADWKELAQANSEFTDAKQSALRSVMSQCSKDTDFSVKKPYDLENENFKYFALCLRNGIMQNPSINNCSTVRKNVLGWAF